MFSHILTRPKLRAERNTSSKIELKLSPTPLSVSEVTKQDRGGMLPQPSVTNRCLLSSDPQDFEALMPNHILLLRRNQSFFLDVFEESDKFKARWKHVHLKVPFMQPVGRRRVPDSQLVFLQKQFLLLLTWSQVVTLKAF